MKSSELVKGKVYFLCMYSNTIHPIPEITPYVFTGKDDGGFHFCMPERFIISEAIQKLPESDQSEIKDYCNADDMAVATEEDLEFFCTFQQMQKFLVGLESHENFGRWY